MLQPFADDETEAEVVVIGAGIIGLSIALRLAQSGHQVVVVERDSVAAGASRGNAGAYAFSDIQPLASPGILKQAPRWLLDPLGPLALRPRYAPQIAPWLWRFWRACAPERVYASTRAQAALNKLSAAATHESLKSIDALDDLNEGGNLHLYLNQAAWQKSLFGWSVRTENGIQFEHLLGGDAIADVQSGLSPQFQFATFVPGWATINDPLQLTLRIAECCAKLGVRLRRAHVQALVSEVDGVRLKFENSQTLRAQRVVVAAGAWSHTLARTLGERIPLEAERGYNTTLPPGAGALNCQLTFPNHGFVMTPIAGGIRVGGAVELAGLQAPPNFKRAEVLLRHAKSFMPGLNTEGGTQWMGFRPSLPDSLPAIGFARGDDRVIYAFGHGHLGLTQSAATAQLVTQLVDGQAPALDLTPFNPQRFN